MSLLPGEHIITINYSTGLLSSKDADLNVNLDSGKAYTCDSIDLKKTPKGMTDVLVNKFKDPVTFIWIQESKTKTVVGGYRPQRKSNDFLGAAHDQLFYGGMSFIVDWSKGYTHD